jgi:hypothetical protein
MAVRNMMIRSIPCRIVHRPCTIFTSTKGRIHPSNGITGSTRRPSLPSSPCIRNRGAAITTTTTTTTVLFRAASRACCDGPPWSRRTGPIRRAIGYWSASAAGRVGHGKSNRRNTFRASRWRKRSRPPRDGWAITCFGAADGACWVATHRASSLRIC